MGVNLLRLLRNIKGEVLKYLYMAASRRTTKRICRNRDNINLEIGAGNRKGSGEWLTLDMGQLCDIYWDLSRGLPFPDNSIKMVYSSHVFEHFTYKEGQELLKECLRVLVPGGAFSIAVPNAKLYIESYISGDDLSDPNFFRYKPAYNDTTRIDFVNYCAYMDGLHKYMFDEENLLFRLQDAGFVDITLRAFDASLDQKDRHHESIYAKGIKPSP